MQEIMWAWLRESRALGHKSRNLAHVFSCISVFLIFSCGSNLTERGVRRAFHYFTPQSPLHVSLSPFFAVSTLCVTDLSRMHRWSCRPHFPSQTKSSHRTSHSSRARSYPKEAPITRWTAKRNMTKGIIYVTSHITLLLVANAIN